MIYDDEESNDPRPRWRILWKCIIIGIVSGLFVTLYRLMISKSNGWAHQIFSFLKENPLYIPLWVILAVLAGCLIHRILVKLPEVGGSGIPQVKGNVKLGHRIIGAPILLARFVGGFVASIFGLSLGREGPSVHIGAAAAEPISKRISDDELENRILLTSGAAAGLSAAFSAPISGMVFALEEIHHSFSEYVLIAGLTSAVLADIVASIVFGMDPVLDFMVLPDIGLEIYIWLIPCGLVGGLLGWLMNRSYMGTKRLFSKVGAKYILPIAFLIALPVGLFFPDAIGGGEDVVQLAEKAESGLLFIITLLVVKIVFSCTSFGSGTPGGIFMPIMAIGALGGSAIGLLMCNFGMPAECVCNCAVLGMAGCLASSLRTPVTAVLLVTEMTATMIHLLPVAICVLIAYSVSGLMKTKPIYRLLLTDYMEKNPKISAESGKPLSKLILDQKQ